MAKTVIVVRLKSENDLPAVISQLYQSGLVDDVRLVRRHDKGEAAEVTVDDSKAFVARERRGTGGHTRHHNPNGLRSTDCALAIMQRQPDALWAIEDIGYSLALDFQFSANTIWSAVGRLVEHGYAERGQPGYARLTKKGREHPQSKPLERYDSNDVASDEPS